MNVDYQISPRMTNGELNALFGVAWAGHVDRDFGRVLARSLVWIGARSEKKLVGFANLAWDGGDHAFLLDPTVHPEFRRMGIGRAMIAKAVEVATANDVEWIHVDFERELEPFYRTCGFHATHAGLLRVRRA